MSSKKHFTRSIIPLALIIFVDALGFGITFPVFTPIFINNTTGLFNPNTSVQVRNFWFECTIAAYCLFMFINSPVLGSLSDRYGRKKILLLSMTGLAAGLGLSTLGVWINNLFLILFGRVISGATAGSYPIAQAAMIDLCDNEAEKAKRIGLVGVMNGIGFTCGPIIGGLLLDPHLWHVTNYQIPFLFNVAIALLCVVLVKLLFKETFIGNPAQKINLLTSFNNLYNAFTQPMIRSYCLQLLLFMLGYSVFFTSLPVFITQVFHQSPAWIGYYLTYFGGIFTFTLLVLLPKITNKISFTRLVLITLLVAMGNYFAFIITRHETILWVISVPIAIAVPLCYVSLITLLSNKTDSQQQGTIMGVAGSIAALTWGLGPIFSGVFGGVHYITAFSLALILTALALLLFFLSERKHGM